MALWVDKHRPTELSQLTYNVEQAEKLRDLITLGDFPHLLVYGPSGAGKHTRVQCILRELYGAGVDRRRIETREMDTPSGKKLEITTVSSNFHVEINPGDVGVHDRIVVQDVIKTMAQTQQLEVDVQRDFKVVVLHEVDRLTKDAQHALRRTMEKYMSACRLILVTTSSGKVIAPVRSRCLPVRVAAPADGDVVAALTTVGAAEKIHVPPRLAARIAAKAGGNLRRALLMLETCRVKEWVICDLPSCL